VDAHDPPSREAQNGGMGLRFHPNVKGRVVKCPQCKADVPWTPESKWRPFCSERCKMIDLGAWAAERYRVETPETPEMPAGGDPNEK
jgi:endogenous inhibitor of DNA gyrase (YacG/DUF329 family)